MKRLKILFATALLVACGVKPNANDEDSNELTSKFVNTWNVHESMEVNDDGTITYHALPWGGLVGSLKERNLPVDWSEYESISVEFAEPTTAPTQIMVSDKLKTWGKPGITTLTCYFDGQDVTSVSEVGLQSSDTTVLRVKRIYLTPASGTWVSSPIWEGECVFGNWEGGFIVEADAFESAREGDKLEFRFTTDTSTDTSYWLFKTVINETDITLEGNESELNQWGCATVGKGAVAYRIILTAGDIEKLREKGLFVNGYYNIVTQVNLLHKSYEVAED